MGPFGPIFIAPITQMADSETWRTILGEAVEEALKKRPGEPIRGTILKQKIDDAAARRGLAFPPPDEPQLRLGEFLERHRDIIAISRPLGEDLLVAPVDQPQILVAIETRKGGSSRGKAPGIRPDLFKAFTQVLADRRPWYDPSLDEIIWAPLEAQPAGSATIAIPPPTLEEALRVRRSFAETREPDLRASLEQAIASPQPLGTFANVIRAQHLQLDWHTFRTRDLVERITAWAQAANLAWRDGWLISGEQGVALGARDDRAWRSVLQAFTESLEAADIPRIVVPLDLVLRILRRR